MKKLQSQKDFVDLQARVKNQRAQKTRVVRICMTGCRAYGAAEVLQAIQEEIQARGLSNEVEVRQTGCQGFCACAPVMTIDPEGIFYQNIQPSDAVDIVDQTLIGGQLVSRLMFTETISGIKYKTAAEIPFFAKQKRRVLANCGLVDPQNIEHYVAQGGYQALSRALVSLQPEQVIEEVLDSGLKGRGGAGFPTGLKWRFARAAQSQTKYVICNADEGDPGAFMDRAILEGDPHAVIEGLAIAAYAIGAEQAFIYVREEYPIAVLHLEMAIVAAEELGWLGHNILGSNFSFSIELKKGAGAFVCGEETALMASIEGKRGMPRPRPPFPAQAGLGAKPTNINNVETLANIPLILHNGPAWFRELGSDKNSGTKVFSLAGKVVNTGLVEVPIGTRLREIIFDIGGGIPKGRKFKAVQMGGPSGGCIPEKHLDVPVDYESLSALGAIMGSGGMVVMDENNCMVDTARYFLSFTRWESCGKCSPCRLGTRQMLEILSRISRQDAHRSDIAMLERVAKAVRDTSLCGLGQTSANPVLSTLRYFRSEYEEHISQGRCRGAVCEELVISACQHTCPVGINVPHYVAAVAHGNYVEAAQIIRERNPFPAICGRICHHPCETRCRRGELDEPVSIRALKRFAADWYFSVQHDAPEPFGLKSAKKVAVVGAGPTGLTCAFYLRRQGYPVTVFEAQSVGGGMLMVGVPEFRLPKVVVQREVDYIRSCGVEIEYDSPLGEKLTVQMLKEQGYEAILIAAGAQRSQRIGIPGEDENLPGLYYGLHFLRDVKLKHKVDAGPRVLVVGGGNVALDVARSARRLPPPSRGTRTEVHVVCLESREEMPAHPEEVKAALAEGIFIHHRLGVARVLSSANHVCGIQTQQVESVFDNQGRFRPTFRPNSEGQLPCDTLILAVGQAADLSFLPPDSELERNKWERLAVDPQTLATNLKGIFAAGDFVTGPTHIIEAIAAGRRAAMAIDLFCRGVSAPIQMFDARKDMPRQGEPRPEEIDERGRANMPVLPPEDRVLDFREAELGLTEERACQEARRCLRCDLET